MKKRLNLYIALVITVILIVVGVWYQQSNKLINEIKQNSIEVVDEKGEWSFSIPGRYKYYWLDYQDPSNVATITLQEYADKGFSPTIEYQEINGYPAGVVIYDIKPDQDISDFIQDVSFKDNEEKGTLNKVRYNNIKIFAFEYFDNQLDMIFTEYYYQKDNFVFKMVKYPAHENPKTIDKDEELKEFGKVFAFIDSTFTTKINSFKNNTWSLSVPNKYKVKSLGENKDGSTTLELNYVKPDDFAEEFAPSPLLTIHKLKSNQKILDVVNSQREKELGPEEIITQKKNNLYIYSFDSAGGIAGVTYYYIQKGTYVFELYEIYSGEIPDEFLNILNSVDATFTTQVNTNNPTAYTYEDYLDFIGPKILLTKQEFNKIAEEHGKNPKDLKAIIEQQLYLPPSDFSPGIIIKKYKSIDGKWIAKAVANTNNNTVLTVTGDEETWTFDSAVPMLFSDNSKTFLYCGERSSDMEPIPHLLNLTSGNNSVPVYWKKFRFKTINDAPPCMSDRLDDTVQWSSSTVSYLIDGAISPKLKGQRIEISLTNGSAILLKK